MASKGFGFTSLTGGGAGALDAIDGSALAAGYMAFGSDAANKISYTYVCAASSAAADGTTVIIPASNPGTLRWHLLKMTTKDGVVIYDGTNTGRLQFSSNELELYSERHSGIVKVMVEDAGGNKETAAKFTGAGAAELYYDNSKKIETTSTGVTVTGNATATGNIIGVNGTFSGVVSNANERFYANLSGAQSNVTGDGTSWDATGAIWTENYDVGSCFSNGTFTAPRTGLYNFTATVYLRQLAAAHTTGNITIITSGRTHYIFLGNVGAIADATGDLVVGSSTLEYLTSGQTAKINVVAYNGTKVVDVGAINFLGCYLGG